jgi:hypothetical protein
MASWSSVKLARKHPRASNGASGHQPRVEAATNAASKTNGRAISNAHPHGESSMDRAIALTSWG